MKKIILAAIPLMVLLALFIPNGNITLAQLVVDNDSIVQKAKELQKLIQHNRLEGRDVSKAVELDSRSKQAMRQGRPRECLRLLKQAITLLKKGQEKKRQSKPRESFFEVHLEPDNANDKMFNALIDFVDMADQYKVKLTLLFTPQWAEMILDDEAKLSLLNQWKKGGHEIGGHHHGPSVCHWDGYTNLDTNSREFKNRQNKVPCPKSVRAKETYSGNMDDYMELLTKLGQIKTITMSDADVDWPKNVLYSGGGRRLSQAISQPGLRIFNGQNVNQLTACTFLPRRSVVTGEFITFEDLKNKYLSEQDGVFGVVAHAIDYKNNPDIYKQWFEFLNEQDRNMNHAKTVSQIMEESLGLTKVPQGEVPSGVTLDYEDSPFGIFAAFAANEFGYFKAKMGFTDDQYWRWAENHFKNLGVHWTRSNLQLMWHVVEPDYDGKYHWNNSHLTDPIIRRMYAPGNEIHWLGVFDDEGGVFPFPDDFPHDMSNIRNPLDYPDEYKAFVQAVVERYDGDGIDDASPDVKVKYWQAGNEIPFGVGRVSDYVQFVRMVREAVLKADPEAKIVLAAPTNGFAAHPFLIQVINELAAKREFEAIDVHHWETARNWKMPAVPVCRNILDSKGLTDVEIWSTEHGTWQGQPFQGDPEQANPLFFQSEQGQASSLLKRHVYNFANGLDKLFWNNLMEWYEFEGDPGHFSNSMGLVSDGQGLDEDPAMFNTKRLAYYTYKLMVEKLEGSDWNNIQTIQESDDIYIYKFAKNGKSIWVAWDDKEIRCIKSPCGRQIAISGINSNQVKMTAAVPKYKSGKDVPDYNTAFETEIKAVQNGKVNIILILGENPVFVEEK